MDTEVFTSFFKASPQAIELSRDARGETLQYASDGRLVLGTTVDSDGSCIVRTKIKGVVLAYH